MTLSITEYLVGCLAEEHTEVAQAALKCNRFSLAHRRQEGGPSNLEELTLELADAEAIEIMLEQAGVVIDRTSEMYLDRVRDKMLRTLSFMAVSVELGTLDKDALDFALGMSVSEDK